MLYAIYFIYGLSVMFYFMMSWLFCRKDKELLTRLVTVLMFVIGLQCLKDLFFIKPLTELDELDWMMITAADMVCAAMFRLALLSGRAVRSGVCAGVLSCTGASAPTEWRCASRSISSCP